MAIPPRQPSVRVRRRSGGTLSMRVLRRSGRTLTVAIGLALLLMGAPVAWGAAPQDEAPGLQDLWRDYPLDDQPRGEPLATPSPEVDAPGERATTRSTPSEATPTAPSGSALAGLSGDSDRGDSAVGTGLGVLVVLMVTAGAGVLAWRHFSPGGSPAPAGNAAAAASAPFVPARVAAKKQAPTAARVPQPARRPAEAAPGAPSAPRPAAAPTAPTPAAASAPAEARPPEPRPPEPRPAEPQPPEPQPPDAERPEPESPEPRPPEPESPDAAPRRRAPKLVSSRSVAVADPQRTARPRPSRAPSRIRSADAEVEIAWLAGHRRGEFLVVLTSPGSVLHADTRSRDFAWHAAEPPPPSGAAAAAHAELCARLLKDGWTPAGQGPSWFSYRFRRCLPDRSGARAPESA